MISLPPADLKRALDQVVIGQDQTTTALANAFYLYDWVVR